MKQLIIVFCLAIVIQSCKNDSNHTAMNRNITLNDTITTPSGLQYIFLKEGKGRKIEDGSKVKAFTELYINDNQEAFWTTAKDKDSSFYFIHGKSPLITGFAELNNYLVEGDSIVAIIPDSLAYGKEGKNNIPGGATLMYNPYYVKYVSEPKKILRDTLAHIASNHDAEAAIDYYNTIVNSNEKENYHTEIEDMYDLVFELYQDSLYTQTNRIAAHFLKSTNDDSMIQSLSYYRLLALEAQNKYEDALEIAKPLAKQVTNQEWWHSKMLELQDKVSKRNE